MNAAPRFTIRTLFLIVAVTAVCAWMVRTSDWIAAVGFGVASLLLLLAARWPVMFGAPRSRRASQVVLVIAGMPIAWFSVVDRSYSWQWCGHCSDHRFIWDIRLGGFPIHSRRSPTHRDVRSLIRNDLGRPCDHVWTREHLARYRGLVVRARPWMGITCCLFGDPDYYNHEVSRRVREYARENPDAARELCQRIVEQDDYKAMHAFIAEMKQRAAD